MIKEIMTAMGILFSSEASAEVSIPLNLDLSDMDHEISCLADNMYWEARNQSIKGMLAVGYVTMNRVADDRYPFKVCEVVEQGPVRESWKKNGEFYPIRHRCQFSWYCDGKADDVPNADAELYTLIKAMAFKIYFSGDGNDFTEGATHYHAHYVSPEWAATKTKTVQIGDHIFYRWEHNQ